MGNIAIDTDAAPVDSTLVSDLEVFWQALTAPFPLMLLFLGTLAIIAVSMAERKERDRPCLIDRHPSGIRWCGTHNARVPDMSITCPDHQDRAQANNRVGD